MKKTLAILFCLSVCIAGIAQTYPYQDPSLSPGERAADLIGRLSMEQKTALMLYNSPAIPEWGINNYNWWSEALHGSARNGLATVFPQAIGMAASWDDALLQQVFDIASTEQRIKFAAARRAGDVKQYNGLTVWTPNINIFRDPRWGRGQETYGEDPYLTSRMGYAVVNGLQGDTSEQYDKLHACLKHYAIHSGPESERHRFDVQSLSRRDLMETYLFAFRKLVQTTDVKEVMCAYNAFEGRPCCSSDKLLTKILREEWGYRGLVVTDCWAVSDHYKSYGHNIYPNDPATASAMSVISGADLECGDSFKFLMEAYNAGKIKETDIDRAVLRILTARFELGEMDDVDQVKWNKIPEETLACEQHHLVALQMARETMTLLQNRSGILPLPKTGLKYAVIGPNAAEERVLWGNYNGIPRETTSVLEGIVAKVGAENVIYSKGCPIASIAADADMTRYSTSEGNAHDVFGLYKDMLEADFDINEIADADVIIYVGGISPMLEGEEMMVPFEGFKGGDRTSIELPQVQRDFIKKLSGTGKPVVMVGMSGSAVAITPESEACDAILWAWYPGEAGGEAVADVLFGDCNPGGKLPVTFYASDEQLPDFNDYDMAGHTYRYSTEKPLFAFGHGLSYSTFKYGRARIRKDVLRIPVRNTGKVDGTETVQLYVRDEADAEGPSKSLRGFKKVEIPAGKKVVVEIPLTDEVFELYDELSGDVKPQTGTFTLMYGTSSDALKSKKYSRR